MKLARIHLVNIGKQKEHNIWSHSSWPVSILTTLSIMLFYPTIGSKYFAKTQTYVALFGPHELSLIFAGGMCLEQTSL